MTDQQDPRDPREPDALHPPEPDGIDPVVHPLVPSDMYSLAPQLPEDLERLGAELEAAARTSLRRRNRRAHFFQSLGIVILAVPAALGFLSTDLAPSESVSIAVPASTVPPSHGFSVAYIPDEPAFFAAPRSCLDGRDCLSSTPTPDIHDTVIALEGKL